MYRTDRLVGLVRESHEPGVLGDQLHPEASVIQVSAQLITLCPRRPVLRARGVFVPAKPQIDHRTPMRRERTGKRAVRRQSLLPEPLFSSETLSTSRILALEEIGGWSTLTRSRRRQSS